MGWIVPALIGATATFAIALAIMLLASSGTGLMFAIGGVGFVVGFIGICVLLTLPNADVALRIMDLQRIESDQLEVLEAANLAYESSQQAYEHLAATDRLRTDCDKALYEYGQLRAEYRRACDE